MATYVIADIHGEYDMFLKLLEKIRLKDSDTLYILGDILDRGAHPIKTMQKIMEMPNVICLVGNHELMALECLSLLTKEITEESIESFDQAAAGNLISWGQNGSATTIQEFRELSREDQEEILEFIRDFSLYEEVSVDGKEYLLVHAGLGDYSPEKRIDQYSLEELVWSRADYDTQYFEDRYVITGHTPTQHIDGNPKPGFIYRNKNHIAIDCGACMPDGNLAALCLETGKEYY